MIKLNLKKKCTEIERIQQWIKNSTNRLKQIRLNKWVTMRFMLDQNTYRLKDVLRSKIRKWCKRPMSHKVKCLSNVVGFPESNLAKESQVQKTNTLYVCWKQIYWNFSLKGDVMFILCCKLRVHWKFLKKKKQKKTKKKPKNPNKNHHMINNFPPGHTPEENENIHLNRYMHTMLTAASPHDNQDVKAT